MQNNNAERKNKFLGLRIRYDDYMAVLAYTQELGVSITDFMYSLIIPVIDKQIKAREGDIKPIIEQEKIKVPQTEIKKYSFKTKSKTIPMRELFSEENERLLNTYLVKQ